MNTNSVFTGSYTKTPCSSQTFVDSGKVRILKGGQPIVQIDAADICCLSVTIRKGMSFQDDFPSVQFDKCKNDWKKVFDLTLLHDATENCHYPKLF